MKISYRTELAGHGVPDVFAWHERPGALERLLPPWAGVSVERCEGGIAGGGRVTLRVRRGPASLRWELRHAGYEKDRGFRDEQVAGPFARWVHTHRFEPAPGGGTVVTDEVEIEPPLGAAGAALAPALVKRELDRAFRFRHRRLATDLSRHAERSDRPRLTVAVTGASGTIGGALSHFLTTGGHRVLRLVRDRRRVGPDALFWNPIAGEIDDDGLSAADVVVHLAGEPIAEGRWTEERRRAIQRSRVEGTDLLARTLAAMRGSGPRALVSASAVGYYGPRGDERLEESSRPGEGFLARVCREWEEATLPAERAGVRVVRARMGVALSPAGGALARMLLPFNLGLGGRLGSGRQYLSWIDLDDAVGLLHHALLDDALEGPLNLTAPHPVTNATFTTVLGCVLGRPTILPVPGVAVRALFGDLGKEALLAGQRALPSRALERGYRFAYEGLEESLRFQLGR